MQLHDISAVYLYYIYIYYFSDPKLRGKRLFGQIKFYISITKLCLWKLAQHSLSVKCRGEGAVMRLFVCSAPNKLASREGLTFIEYNSEQNVKL